MNHRNRTILRLLKELRVALMGETASDRKAMAALEKFVNQLDGAYRINFRRGEEGFGKDTDTTDFYKQSREVQRARVEMAEAMCPEGEMGELARDCMIAEQLGVEAGDYPALLIDLFPERKS